MFKIYHLSAGSGPKNSENIIDEVLKEGHRESQDRFDADALNAKHDDITAVLESDSLPLSPVARISLRQEAASEYFRETLDYLPSDTPPDVFKGVVGNLRMELDAAHREIEELGPCGDETAADRQDHALHLCYHERLPYLGRKTLPYSFEDPDKTEGGWEAGCENGGDDSLPCTAEVLGDADDDLAGVLSATVGDLIEHDDYGKATFDDLRQIGRWFHTADINQYVEEYGEQYKEPLELLYGILELRRLSVIIGKTTRERSLDNALEFCYVAIVTQAHMKTRWREAVIERMKRHGQADDDDGDSTDD
jgi:hypothetical protein